MSDPDFSFAAAKKEREVSRRRLEPPPRRKTGPGWKVTGAGEPEPPRWEVVTEKGGIVIHREVGPQPGGGGFARPEHERSLFRLEVTDACFVAGQLAEVGHIVECGHRTAADLLSSGRGRILEELRNHFA
jgi:hypothetical protein